MNAWDVSDAMLKRLLDNFRSVNASKTYHCVLYQNDYKPHPGSSTGDFIWASFPGVTTGDFLISDFPPASVTANVAMITLNHALTYTASSSGSFSQPVYGYAVFDDAYNYAWAERFATTYTVVPSFQLQITPRYRQKTCAASMLTARRRSRSATV